jgi:primosomal protein N' (replication factor Y)
MTESNPQPPSERRAVLMPTLVDTAFDYLVPQGTAEGTLVEATLAGRKMVGAVWTPAPGAVELPVAKLKPVTRVLAVPPLKQSFRAWLDWVSDYTLAPKGAVLSLCGLPYAAKITRKKFEPQLFTITLPTLTDAQQTVLERLQQTIEGAERVAREALPQRGRVGVGAESGTHSPHITMPLAQTQEFARKLRSEMTDAEWKLWYHLRREGLGVKFRKQHPIGKYIADFACLNPKLIIELDGGQHNETEGMAHDVKRSAFLNSRGFKVLRFWNNDVLQNTEAVLQSIIGEIDALIQPSQPITPPQPLTPPPLPSPSGGGLLAATPPPASPIRLKPILLDGVTGSGKTEVYFHAIAEAVDKRSQVLVLLPEISLTHQWLERFRTVFGAEPCLWHSRLSPAARARTWQAIARGEANVVVGARSALFLPFENLGIIVVDEEHDPSYKQEDGVLYHARDMAVARARFERVPILLVSATPSLETLTNVREGKYTSQRLSSRFGAAGMPHVQCVDLRLDTPERGEFLSPTVKRTALDTLARGEQVLFFLNRRGYAPLLLCRACGHRFQCSHCSAWLVVHGKGGAGAALHCHHCGHKEKFPDHCPSCNAEPEKLAACGPGVERIAEEVRALVPDRGSMVTLSSDESIPAETWAMIERGEVDILVGTQMVAKGHHFPRLTLVVVVDADVGLDGADLRAAERTYQLLHQLGGRAGRGDLPGQVLIQTYAPEHPVMKALVAQDRDRLMALEARERQAGGWPPFGQLAAIVLDGKDEAAVRAAARALALCAPMDKRLRVLGPAPAPLSKLRGQFRYRLLVKADRGIHLQRTLRAWLSGQRFKAVRVRVDISPYYFL